MVGRALVLIKAKSYRTKGKFYCISTKIYRLTPTYGFIVGMLANLYKYIGSGPVIQLMSADSGKQCRKFWWHNLLYINNLWEYDVEKGEAMVRSLDKLHNNDRQ